MIRCLNPRNHPVGRQRGFTLVELLSVFAIIGVLAGVIAGSVQGLEAAGRSAQIQSDSRILEIASDRFFTESFPQTYPVSNPDTNGDAVLDNLDSPPLPAGYVNVSLVDFNARLPQHSTKQFVPDFIKGVPNSAALVSYRVLTTNGDVFAAAAKAPLIPPSASRLNVTVADKSTGAATAVTFGLTMRKNRAAVDTLVIQIPAGYIFGGPSLPAGVEVGQLDVFFDADNPCKPGHILKVSTPVLATGRTDMWEISPNYATATSEDNGDVVDTVKGAIQADGVTRGLGPTITHTIDVSASILEFPGSLTLRMGISQGAGTPHNESTESWVLKIYSYSDRNTGSALLIANPKKAGVYRWTSEEHSTIQVADMFESVAGLQAVLIRDDVAIVTPTAVPDTTGPVLRIISPYDGANGVAVGIDIVASFSERISVPAVDETTFVVLDERSQPIPGAVTVAGNGRSAIFDPDIDLAHDTAYTITLTSGITDQAGNRMVSYSSIFTTEETDTTSPSVLGISPLENATGVATDTVIDVFFSEAVDGATVDFAGFNLLDSASNVIAGTISLGPHYGVANRRLIFHPTGDLANDTTYAVTLTGGISDPALNSLEPFASTFTTEAAPNRAPQVTVTGDITGGAFAATPDLVFSAEVTDDNEGATLTAFVEWFIDGTPTGVTGTTMSMPGLGLGNFNGAIPAIGPHVIEARSLDRGGLTGFGTLVFTLTPVNPPPDVIIVSPGGNGLFSGSSSISFLAVALDAEDGFVTKGLVWNSSIDGLIGAGGNFSATLTAGTHTITASALDSGNVLGSASVIVKVFDALRWATPGEWEN